MTCVHADLDLDSRGFIDAPCGAPDPNLICPHFHLSLYVHGPQRLLWKVWVLSVFCLLSVTDRSVEQILVFDVQAHDVPR